MASSVTTHGDHLDEGFEDRFFLYHLVDTLRRYRIVILVTLLAAVVAYALMAIGLLVATPAQRVTAQPFRLDFEGAANGKFPNGLRFSTSDIVTPAILLQVYRENDLQRYASFQNFSRSVFVLEANRAYEALAAEFQARLADPKLSTVDRERVLKEYEQKREAIAKNEYSLEYLRFEGVRKIPDVLVKKLLADTLTAWSEHAIKDQDVLAYRVAVLSPSIVTPSKTETDDPLIAVLMLRTRTLRLLDNLAELEKLPGAELARASANRISLEEIRMRMEEIQRYRIEPLINRVSTSGPTSTNTMRFLHDQLDYDQRQLTAARRRADSIRETLGVYEQSVSAASPATATALSSQQPSKSTPPGGETVMPQLSDTFIDRMADLLSKSADAQYRQQIVNDYRKSMEAVVPPEQAVAYDNALIATLQGGKPSAAPVTAQTISTDVEATREELRTLISQMNDIYREISRNIYSTSQLVTITAPATTSVARAVDVAKLLLWGVAVLLLTLPLTVIGCVLHDRVQKEESEEQYLATSAAS